MIRYALALAFAATASAGPLCTAGASLASYEALGVSGCVVDPSNSLSVGAFSYSVLSSSNPGVVTPDTDISVTPITLGPGHVGIDFTSGTFDVSGSDFVNYQIGFTWDPPPIRSGDDVFSDPVTAPGLAKVNTTLCLGAAFTGISCSMSIAALTVSDNGISPVLTDSATFTPVITLGVLNVLELDGGGGSGSAIIDGFSNDITVTPEPATLLTVFGGFLTLMWRRRLERK
jgi:PEP-CTERM motif